MTAAQFIPGADTEENYAAIKIIAARARCIEATGQNGTENVPSPCMSVCRVDTDSGWCYGCLRTLNEIAAWSKLSDDGKRDVWKIIERRAAVSLAALNALPGEAP